MKKLYSYSESGRGWTIEGMFVSTDENNKRLFGKDLYYGEVCGKHSELSLRFSEDDLKVVTEDQDFIEKFEQLIGYTGYNPFDYIEPQWVVKYDFGNVDGVEYFDDEDEAHERYEELSEDAEDHPEASVEIYQEEY